MKKIALFILVMLLTVPLLTACAPDTVVLYTDLPQDDVNKLVAPFIEKTGIKVNVVTFGSSDTMVGAIAAPGDGSRNSSESAAPTATPNPNPADIVLTKGMLAMTELTDRNALESYMSTSVADLPYGANGGGWWYGFGGKGWVIAWNTDLVTKKPDSFQDLANSAYPMKTVTLPNPQQFYYYPLAVYSVMGADYTLNIFQTLLLNGTRFATSPMEAANDLANGQLQVAITTYEQAKAKKDGGAPVDFAFPDQGQTDMGAYVEFYSVGLAKGGKYLKGAKQLDDWLLSTEAEALSVQLGLSDVTLRDVGGSAPVVKPLVVSPSEVIANTQEASDAFNRMASQT